MISKRSLVNFMMTNLFLLGYGYIENQLYQSTIFCIQDTPFYGFQLQTFTLLLLMAFFRNYFLYCSLSTNTARYRDLHSFRKPPLFAHYLFYFSQASILDALSQYLYLQGPLPKAGYGTLATLLFFIPLSFPFEITFDLFHYIAHRAEHTYPFLYRHFHKLHHQHQHPTLITTYYHHIGDLLLTNTIPFHLTLFLFAPLISTHLFFSLYITKIYLELCGHSGKYIPKTGSFVQCIWLPSLLGISLYTQDHDAHHRFGNGNFGKRFTLWDRVFGTSL